MRNKKQQIFTIPNILSFIRLLLIPICVVVYLNAETAKDFIIAGAILAASCITDTLDGIIARKFNMITTLGKILDPIADKGTQFAMMLTLAVKFPVIWCIVPLFVIKESFQFIVGAYHYKKGKMLKGALFIGKISTTVLFVSMIALIVFPNIPNWGSTVIVAVCLCFLIASFVSYILAYYGKNKKVYDLEK